MTSSRGGLSTTPVTGARSVVIAGWIIAKSGAFRRTSLHAWVRSAGHTHPAGSETARAASGGAAMDATCKICGDPADVGAKAGAGATCASCTKRAERHRLIFDVGESPTSGREPPTPREGAPAAESSPREETRMVDLLNLARRTRESLANTPEKETLEIPISVREAILFVDSISPASIEPAPPAPPPLEVGLDPAPYPLGAPTSPTPARRRLQAIYSGIGLLVVMAGLVVAKARVGQEVASAAGLTPEAGESTATLTATPQTLATPASPVFAAPKSTTTPTVAPAATPRRAPTRPAPTRPKAPADDGAPEMRASADSTPPSHSDLLGAMAAAVAAHSAPSSAPKVDSTPAPPGGPGGPGGPGAPSPSVRGEPRTSPLHP